MIWKEKPSNFTVSHIHDLHAVMLAGSPKSISQLVTYGSQGTQAAQHNARRSPQQATGLLHLPIQEVQVGQVTLLPC